MRTKFRILHFLKIPFWISVGVALTLGAGAYFYSQEKILADTALNTLPPVFAVDRQSYPLDYDGDGNNEVAVSFAKDYMFEERLKDINFPGYIAVYAADGREIARTADDLELMTGMVTVKGGKQLESSNKKEYLWLQQIAGAHHFNDIFLQVLGDQLIPICKAAEPQQFGDCFFFNTSFDEILTEDLDSDGFYEVTEIVDEYPPTGGRGKPVLSAIYTFNGSYFEPRVGEDYDRLLNLLVKKYKSELDMDIEILHRDKWTQESKSNFNQNKDFWSGTNN